MGLICAYLAGYLWLFRRELRFPHAFAANPDRPGRGLGY